MMQFVYDHLGFTIAIVSVINFTGGFFCCLGMIGSAVAKPPW